MKNVVPPLRNKGAMLWTIKLAPLSGVKRSMGRFLPYFPLFAVFPLPHQFFNTGRWSRELEKNGVPEKNGRSFPFVRVPEKNVETQA